MTDRIAAAVSLGDSVLVITERGRVFTLERYVFSERDIVVTEITPIPLDAAPAGECQVFEDRDAP